MSRYQTIHLLVLAFCIASVAGGSPGEVEVATPGTLAHKYFVVKLSKIYI
jgi:hypothetical protein